MDWRESARAGLPPQRHQEPTSLRQDILDELGDHLTLAQERELDTGSCEEREVRERVLEQFGDPTKVARALWWDAMRETVMKDWIQVAVNVVLCIGVIGFMTLFYRQMQTTNTALLEALNDRPGAAEELYPSVEFVLHRGSVDGPVASGVNVQFEGKIFTEEGDSVKGKTDTGGRVKFGPFRAGIFTVRFSDPVTGLGHWKRITAYSGEGTKTFHIAIPPTNHVALDVTAPLAERLRGKGIRFITEMTSVWPHEGIYWRNNQKSVLVTSDGIFKAESPLNRNNLYRAGERVRETFGTQVRFNGIKILGPEKSQLEGSEWSSKIHSMNWRSAVYDLTTGEREGIIFDFPDEQLADYDFEARYNINKNHELPERFSWFPREITHRISDYVIDEALLVTGSAQFRRSPSSFEYFGGERTWDVYGNIGMGYSLEGVPRDVPADYKVILAFPSPSTNYVKLDDRLVAHFDTVSDSYFPDINQTYEIDDKKRDAIWALDATSIAENQSGQTFLDLTDALRGTDFEEASGIMFQWETESENSISLPRPERVSDNAKPVWLVLKPWDGGIDTDAASS